MSKIYQYYVEGECEEKFLNIFKNPKYSKILSGKVSVLNFVQNEISDIRLMQLKKNTIIILIYDTDVERIDILDRNIKKLNKYGFKNIYHIHSVNNFEDEIVRSTKLNNILNFFDKCNSYNEFKKQFLHASDQSLIKKFNEFNFNFDIMWSQRPNNGFKKYYSKNSIDLIKK